MAIDTTKKFPAQGSRVRPNEGVIKQIINFAAGLLPKKLVRAIDIILHPCCDGNITSVKVTCEVSSPSTYDIVITIDKPINLNGGGYFEILANSLSLSFNESVLGTHIGKWDDSATTIHLTGVVLDPYVPGDYVLSLGLYLPTSLGPTDFFSFSPSVVTLLSTVPTQITFPDCTIIT